MWNVLNKIHLKLLFVGFVVIYVISFYLKQLLPNPADVLFSVSENEPAQKEVKKDPFQQQIKGYLYTITPHYSYEFYGLIVSDYDSNNIFDYYHKEDPANTKDICIVWGDNIKNNSYKKASYSSGQFSCAVSWDSSFQLNKWSNNHLIPANDNVARAIKSAKKSDQVYVRGFLVDYNVDGRGTRSTSISREDSGKHGCEIVYVEEFKIIKSQNKVAGIINTLSFWAGATVLLIFILRFTMSPYRAS